MVKTSAKCTCFSCNIEHWTGSQEVAFPHRLLDFRFICSCVLRVHDVATEPTHLLINVTTLRGYVGDRDTTCRPQELRLAACVFSDRAVNIQQIFLSSLWFLTPIKVVEKRLLLSSPCQ